MIYLADDAASVDRATHSVALSGKTYDLFSEACVRVMPTASAPDLGAAFLAVLERVGGAPAAPGPGPCPEQPLGAGVEDEHVGALRSFFGLQETANLQAQGRLPVCCSARCAVSGAEVFGFGLPAFRGGPPWQVCNEAAAFLSERCRRRQLAMALPAFLRLLRERVADAPGVEDGPALATCEGEPGLALAADVADGRLEVLTGGDVLARLRQALGDPDDQSPAATESQWPARARPGAGSGVPQSAQAYLMPTQPAADGAPRTLVVGGLRYCPPYERWEPCSLPDAAAGMALQAALAAFVRDPQGHLHGEAWWAEAIYS